MSRTTAVSALIVLLVAAAARGDVDFAGAYAIDVPQGGTLTLTLFEEVEGSLEGTLEASSSAEVCTVMGDARVDEEGEWSVEGEIVCAQGRSDFELSLDEDGEFMLVLVPYDATDTPRLDLMAMHVARPLDVDEALGEQRIDDGLPDGESTQRDPRLVGIWSTQVIMNTPGGSVATQLLMEFRADGTLIDLGSRTVGGAPGVHGDTGYQPSGDVAVWKTRGKVLEVGHSGHGWVPLATYEVSGDRVLFVYYDGDRKLWHRQR